MNISPRLSVFTPASMISLNEQQLSNWDNRVEMEYRNTFMGRSTQDFGKYEIIPESSEPKFNPKNSEQKIQSVHEEKKLTFEEQNETKEIMAEIWPDENISFDNLLEGNVVNICRFYKFT